jgi:hypothetical protein
MAAITTGQLALGKKALGQHAREEAQIPLEKQRRLEPPYGRVAQLSNINNILNKMH